jgi:small conductance mechanosensitive channel
VALAVTVAEGVRVAAISGATVLLAWLVGRAISASLLRAGVQGHIARLTARAVGLVILLAGLVYVLYELKVRLAPLLGALGIGGIALAVALSQILQNFFAGILLQIRQPIWYGDQVMLSTYEGTVRDINFRTVELETFDGLTVFVPNSSVLATAIVNYTRTPVRRSRIDVGVDMTVDIEQAGAVLAGAAAAAEGVVAAPAPEAWFTGFGESATTFAVLFWHPSDIATTWRVQHAAGAQIRRALAGAGIGIPYPIRVLSIPERAASNA